MPPRFWWSLAAAALLNLDRQAFGQLALSRPLVVGGLVGLALGQVQAGLCLGLWTELLWLARPPLGGHIPPNGGLAVSAALLGVAVVAWGPPEPLSPLLAAAPAADAARAGAAALDPAGLGGAVPAEAAMPAASRGPLAPGPWTALWVLAFAAVPPLARLMTGIETISRRRAVARTAVLKEAIAEGTPASLMAFQLSGLLVILGLTAIFLVGGMVAVGGLLSLALEFLPAGLWPCIGRLGPLMPVVGVAVMTENLAPRHLALFALALAASLFAAALGAFP